MFCSILSYACAGLQYGMISVTLLQAPLYISKFPGATFKNLYRVWYARITRRVLSVLVRTPLRKSTLQLINFNIPVPSGSGCVIVVCHTPWKRILAQWCLENNFALIIGGGKWTGQRKIIQRQGGGVTELRSIVRHLQLKGRVILAADFFNDLNNCGVTFLGKEHNASIVHARLAVMAKVPLMVVIPKLVDTSIDFALGPQFECNDLKTDHCKKIQHIVSFLEQEIESDPSIWSSYVY